MWRGIRRRVRDVLALLNCSCWLVEELRTRGTREEGCREDYVDVLAGNWKCMRRTRHVLEVNAMNELKWNELK